MRPSLTALLKRSIVLKYDLPAKHKNGSVIPKVKISTDGDRCLEQKGSNQDVSSIIYNGIVEYAYNDSEIDLTQLDSLQSRALITKLKYNKSGTEKEQLGHGFYGEILLHLILEHFYGVKKCIARGYFYSALENSEIKGYDSYLMVEEDDHINLFFGEAKFYISGYQKSVESIFESMDDALSDDYLERNLYAFDSQYLNITEGCVLKRIIEDWRANVEIRILEYAKKYNIKLVYPMLVIFHNRNKKQFDDRIKAIVDYINDKEKTVAATLSIPVSYFFVFLPVGDSKEIKKAVIEWIKNRQSVMQ